MEQTTRRRAFIFGLGSFTVAGLGIAGAQKILSPYQGRSTVGMAPTEKAYFKHQPELSSGKNTLWSTLITNEMDVDNSVNRRTIPNYLKNNLDIDYESDFWVALVAILPSDSDFSPGRGYFDEGTLSYLDSVRYTDDSGPVVLNRVGTPLHSASQMESPESKRGLAYHYVFHRWTQALPFTEPPSEVTISWSQNAHRNE